MRKGFLLLIVLYSLTQHQFDAYMAYAGQGTKSTKGKSDRPTHPQPKTIKADLTPTTLPFTPKKGEHIVFIGNALAERMNHHGHFEMMLHRMFPDKEITFRNMGRPGDTPGYRPEAGNDNPWAFPGAKKYHPEIKGHTGKGHYPSPDEWLTICKADTIVAFFGFNESFLGPRFVKNFQRELIAWIDHTRTKAYNGKSAPKIVLVSPIPMEQHGDYSLPDASKRNKLLSQYSKAISQVAASKKVGYVDLYQTMSVKYTESRSFLTFNGIHLSDYGYEVLAPILMSKLFDDAFMAPVDKKVLQRAVLEKSWFWRNDYRMLNGVHVYGRRWAPYGKVNYPEEIEKMREMTVLRDKNIWDIVAGKSKTSEVDDSQTKKLSEIDTNYKLPITYLDGEDAIKKMTVPKGYQVNLFASEKDFPLLQNPAQMTFDSRGRLWVSVIPSYPHYRPGDEMPNDKIIILEDTDGDYKADKQTVFAAGLSLPIGFELAPQGVYVSEEPYLTLLRDTDGDGQADRKDYILDGFDSHDTHHAISAFTTDPQGAIYMCEGVFLHSQVETPYGPQRMTNGGLWRFDPYSWKVERFSQTRYANPWGVAFDKYGQNFISDASNGSHYWLLPLSVKVPHSYEIPKVEKFNYEHRVRPTSGSEFISSTHFPLDVQGDYLYCNTIGFKGIKQFEVMEDGTGIRSKFKRDLLSSKDPNFRPVDLEFAPDGSLYFVDWHNALIGHMQHSARDPNRSSKYGRVYRLSFKEKPLLKPAKVAGASIDTLLNNLKLKEYQTRKRSMRELRGRNSEQVISRLNRWSFALKKNDMEYEFHLLNALWVSWGMQKTNIEVLKKCLNANDHRVRAAAVRVIRHSPELQKNRKLVELYLKQAARDRHGRVRLEALAAGSWMGKYEGTRVILESAKYPIDKWIEKPLNASMQLLKSWAEVLVKKNRWDMSKYDGELASQLLTASVKVVKDDKKKVPPPKIHLKGNDLRKYNVGKAIYLKDGHCATCHQKDGKGLMSIYPPLAKSDWLQDEERLIKLTLHGLFGDIKVNGKEYGPKKGSPPMTAFRGLLNDDEIAAVLTYVRNSWGNKLPVVKADTVEKIRMATKKRKTFYKPSELEKPKPKTTEKKKDSKKSEAKKESKTASKKKD